MSTKVELRIEGPIARIVFSSPGGINLLSSDVRASLAEHLATIQGDRQCRIVVIAAEGRTFLAGADIKELHAVDAATAVRFARDGQMLFERLAALEPVTLAVINGACAGGGCELALACDLRLACQSVRIGLPETSLGFIPGWGGTVRMTRLLGVATAKAVILSGELLTAAEALRIGLVHRVVADAELTGAAEAWVSQLLSRGPEALRRAKETIETLGGSEEISESDAFALEAAEFLACYESGEPAEGLKAFLEKRPPEWGRRAET